MTRIAKRAIVFDWDGTLFDSMTYKLENFLEIFQDFTHDSRRVTALHKHYSGLPREILFKSVYRDILQTDLIDEDFQLLSERYTKLNLSASRRANVFADTLPVLNSLRGRYKMFVSSSADEREVRAGAEKTGIAPLFAEILGSRPGFSKGPGHINWICNKHDLQLQDLVFIGDDKQDVELAQQSQIDCFQIVRSGATATSAVGVLSSLFELQQAIAGHSE